MISIFRPGFLANRRNDFRIIDFIMKFVPGWVIPKVKTTDLAKAMVNDAE